MADFFETSCFMSAGGHRGRKMSSGRGKAQVNREGAVPDYYFMRMGKFRIP